MKVPNIFQVKNERALSIQMDIGGNTVIQKTGQLSGKTKITLDQSYNLDGKLIFTLAFF